MVPDPRQLALDLVAPVPATAPPPSPPAETTSAASSAAPAHQAFESSIAEPATPASPTAGYPQPRPGLATELTALIGRPLDLAWSTGDRTLLSYRAGGRRLELRLCPWFADAPAPVLRAIAAFVTAPTRSPARRAALAALRTFVAERQRSAGALAPPARPRSPRTLISAGRHHDLAAIRDRLIGEHFAAELGAAPPIAIGWGQGRPSSACRRARRRGGGHIRLGSYEHERRLIRIHPRLDQPDVPAYVVAAVVHHELLHAALPPAAGNGRRVVHSAAFRRRERAYPPFRQAEAWLAKNLTRLLR